eukprot:TRINITY_DN31446_c0_g1_i1.p1 TRINITY_DN31446_c0_g1~~TRINITY_DN31446_c0_g1_i1.p1  ORF type:complete len:120 (-),score=20.00 TRINITY_DN31446_c0_g1_i1:14-352(-)
MAFQVGKHAVQWNYLATRLMVAAARDKEVVGNSAVDFLMYSGYASLAYYWLRMADVALTKAKTCDPADRDFYNNKLVLAQFYFDRILPRTNALHKTILASPKSTMKLSEEHF